MRYKLVSAGIVAAVATVSAVTGAILAGGGDDQPREVTVRQVADSASPSPSESPSPSVTATTEAPVATVVETTTAPATTEAPVAKTQPTKAPEQAGQSSGYAPVVGDDGVARDLGGPTPSPYQENTAEQMGQGPAPAPSPTAS